MKHLLASGFRFLARARSALRGIVNRASRRSVLDRMDRLKLYAIRCEQNDAIIAGNANRYYDLCFDEDVVLRRLRDRNLKERAQ